MASVYRKTHLRIDPQTGERVRRKSRKWWIKYRDADGRVRREPGLTDKAASTALAVKREREQALIEKGLRNPYEDHAARPLTEHIADYRRFLTAKGTSADHVALVIGRIERLVDGCGAIRAADLAASRVQECLANLKAEGLSAQTCNFYLQAGRQLLNWMVREQRLPHNPLLAVSAMNVRTDRRHDRRALSEEEFARLLSAAESGGTVEGVSGEERQMIYLVAAATGLRRKELASLTVRSIGRAGETVTLAIAATDSKNKRDDTLPLHPYVAERLQTWVNEHELAADSQLFHLRTMGGSLRDTAKMMQRDLEAARSRWIKEAETDDAEVQRREQSDFLLYRNQSGQFADFHANRHTFISNLCRAGVHPKMAQSLARHSTINLTMDVYSHVALEERAEAVAGLPMPSQVGRTTAPESKRSPEVDSLGNTKMVPQVVPCGAPNGAQRVSQNDDGLSPVGTSEQQKGSRDTSNETPRNSHENRHFGTRSHSMTTPGTAAGRESKRVHPAGFEPATPGSEDRCSIR